MKRIVTFDKANQPYGFPQLDANNNIAIPVASQMFMHPQTITSNINIPAQYNAFLVGPVGIQGTVAVGSGSNLSIL